MAHVSKLCAFSIEDYDFWKFRLELHLGAMYDMKRFNLDFNDFTLLCIENISYVH